MKKILILTTTFYPDPSVASVRVTQFARHLPQYGFLPIIVCKDYGYRATDQQLANDVYPSIKICRLENKKNNSTVAFRQVQDVKSKSFKNKLKKKFHSFAIPLQDKLLKKGFGGLFVPSQSVLFWKKRKKKIFKIFKEEQPDVILSTSPPHAMHWVAKSIKRRWPEKLWVADFRDPYTIDTRYAPAGISKFMFPLHRIFERSVYDSADLLTHAIPLHARWARYVFPEAREKIYILTNGIPENLINCAKTEEKKTNSIFIISSVGSIDNDNANKLASMARLLLKEGLNIQLRFVGKKPYLKQNLIDELRDRLVQTGPVNHDIALSAIATSDLLVSCLSEDRSKVYGLSSKLFEYLATGKPILIINPSRSDRVFAREFKNIVSLENPTVNELCKTVPEMMKQDMNLSTSEVAAICQRFNRKEQVARLAEEISKSLDRWYR